MHEAVDPWQFPCRFPIKAMGLATADIRTLLLQVLKANNATPHPDDLVWRVSNKGKYISITATIHATSKDQLEAIYAQLRQDERIRYLL